MRQIGTLFKWGSSRPSSAGTQARFSHPVFCYAGTERAVYASDLVLLRPFIAVPKRLMQWNKAAFLHFGDAKRQRRFGNLAIMLSALFLLSSSAHHIPPRSSAYAALAALRMQIAPDSVFPLFAKKLAEMIVFI